MSEPRFSTYLRAAAFHLPLQTLEVVLRNRIVEQLRDYYGDTWWDSDIFLRELNPGSQRVLKQSKRRVLKDRVSISEGQMVAALSFGFWSSLMDPGYDFVPFEDWMAHQPSFEVLFVRRSISRVCILRNRISHHEPVFQMDLSYEYSFIMRVLKWLCPATHDWVRPHCHIPTLLRQKP